MSVARVSLQPAFVLHQPPYRDTSAVLEIFQPEFGRLVLVAGGCLIWWRARWRAWVKPGVSTYMI